MPKIIKVNHSGNRGNRMFQYMFGHALHLLVPDSIVVGHDIPDAGICCKAEYEMPHRVLKICGAHLFNLNRIAFLLNSDAYDAVELVRFFAQRIEYYQDRERFQSLFSAFLPTDERLGVPTDSVLISVRAAEILTGGHMDYLPLPISFYTRLVADLGLHPVFMGQIGTGEYFAELKRSFPSADFIPSRGAAADFNMISNSKNIVCSISSFCWIAAWLSQTPINIHLPLYGLFNPMQRRDVDLAPTDDQRFHFYRFPVVKWHASNEQMRWLVSEDVPLEKLDREAVADLKGQVFACAS